MRKLPYQILFLTLISTIIFSCSNEPRNVKHLDKKAYEKPLLEANKQMVKTEDQHIEDLLSRYKWDMTETGSGLRYMIYDKGEGEKAKKGRIAKVDYTIKNITGDIIYSSEEDGPLSFVIGNGEVISGLEEGILFLNVGDKAKFIIPSHLAFGLVGDDDLIPGKASLIYDIKLLELTDQIN